MKKDKKEPKVSAQLSKLSKRLLDSAPGFIKSKNYKALANLGAALGAFYLEEGLADGKSEEKVSFMPEVYLYKNGKCKGLVLISGAKSQNDLNKIVAATVKAPSVVLLLIHAAWVSKLALTNGGRPSQQPDRVNTGIGTVYVAGNVVASVGKQIKLRKKLAA
jgi:hypothetical protein